MVAGLLVTSPTYSQETSPPENKSILASIQCDSDKTKVFDIVTKKHGEKLLGKGQLLMREATKGMFHKAEMYMTLNIKSGSWSIIGVFPDGTGCLVTSGTMFTPYAQPKQEL